MKNIAKILVFLGAFIGIFHYSTAQDFEPTSSTFTINHQPVVLSPNSVSFSQSNFMLGWHWSTASLKLNNALSTLQTL